MRLHPSSRAAAGHIVVPSCDNIDGKAKKGMEKLDPLSKGLQDG